MFRRILLLTLWASVACGADSPSPGASPSGAPPSEASIKQLLELAQAQKLIESVMKQMDGLMTQTIAQATQGKEIPATGGGDPADEGVAGLEQARADVRANLSKDFHPAGGGRNDRILQIAGWTGGSQQDAGGDAEHDG
jgi:hypothetical protein